jgi:hypothetical protein
LHRFISLTERLIWEGVFRGRFGDRAHAIEVFNRHIEEVKRVVPKDRLLVYEVSEGWGPLCSFLGVPIPEDQPFPHLNDAAEFQARIRKGKRNLWIIALTIVGTVVLVVGWLASRLYLKEAPKNAAERQHRRDHEHLDAAAGVDGIEAFYDRCLANGAKILRPLTATAWGTKDFSIEDPDGYIIAFGGRPSSPGASQEPRCL